MKRMKKFLLMLMVCMLTMMSFGMRTEAASQKTFTVVYKANGGTGSMTSTKVRYGVAVNLRKNSFKRTGYTFAGWKAYRTSDKKWRTKENGWQTKATIEKKGYSLFVYKDAAAVSKTTSVNKDTVTMYAVWKKNTYTVAYKAAGGTGSMASTKVTYGGAVSLRKNSFKRTGYTFTGWNAYRASDKKWRTKENGWQTKATIEKKGYSLFVYKDAAAVSKTTSVNKDTITMYAVWKKNTYTVVYNASDGTGSMASTKVTYGVTVSLRKNAFKRTGYTFTGWNAYRASDKKWRTKENGWQTEATIDRKGYSLFVYKDASAVSKTTSVNKDTVTMYAVWKNNEYMVMYDAGVGNAVGGMELTGMHYGQDGELNNIAFEYPGYVFAGWNAYRKSDQKWYTEEAGWQTKTAVDQNGYTLYVYENAQKVLNLTSCGGDTIIMYATWVSESSRSMISINHRGYNTIAPENTLSAFRLSAEKGFHYVETDISFTSDHEAVLLHDSTIDRTSDGTGKISEMTLEEVRQYDFGSWKSDAYAGEQIPVFEEFIQLCSELHLMPYIEIKSTAVCSREDVEKMVDTVRAYGMRKRVTWISFSDKYLSYVRDYDPDARLGYTVHGINQSVIDKTLLLKTTTNEVFINADYGALKNQDGGVNRSVFLCRKNGIPLEIWTICSTETICSLNPYITGVTSNSLNANSILQITLPKEPEMEEIINIEEEIVDIE
ncbi:MAG: glycerophosphodiester phosphodiesterase family protein [Lachnospiraceae bacterium]|nr:glycerophosphodiester phosphodiesterase family protein [Lachnospiraceae bacterium]